MIILRKLHAAEEEETSAHPPPQVRAAVADEPRPGAFRRVTLGEEGVCLRCGGQAWLIPLQELFALAAEAEHG